MGAGRSIIIAVPPSSMLGEARRPRITGRGVRWHAYDLIGRGLALGRVEGLAGEGRGRGKISLAYPLFLSPCGSGLALVDGARYWEGMIDAFSDELARGHVSMGMGCVMPCKILDLPGRVPGVSRDGRRPKAVVAVAHVPSWIGRAPAASGRLRLDPRKARRGVRQADSSCASRVSSPRLAQVTPPWCPRRSPLGGSSAKRRGEELQWPRERGS